MRKQPGARNTGDLGFYMGACFFGSMGMLFGIAVNDVVYKVLRDKWGHGQGATIGAFGVGILGYLAVMGTAMVCGGVTMQRLGVHFPGCLWRNRGSTGNGAQAIVIPDPQLTRNAFSA